jgi:hypothetical protein
MYVRHVFAWVNKHEKHPGPPPAAYESYRHAHPSAPLPSDFPDIEQQWIVYNNMRNSECNVETLHQSAGVESNIKTSKNPSAQSNTKIQQTH